MPRTVVPPITNNLSCRKADSPKLVLDGQFPGEQPSEVDLDELLQMALVELNRGALTMIDEAKLEIVWPAVRASLAVATRLAAAAGAEGGEL